MVSVFINNVILMPFQLLGIVDGQMQPDRYADATEAQFLILDGFNLRMNC